jgi:hypothetical protein
MSIICHDDIVACTRMCVTIDGADHLETHDQNFVFSHLNTCGHNPYITSSLTRGWVCHLQLLLALASAFLLRNSTDLVYYIRNEPHRKHRFHLYSPTIPSPLHVYSLPQETVYRAVA